MRWPAILGVSLAAHAAVIAVIPGGRVAAKVEPPAPVVTIEPWVAPMVDVVPMDVVLLPAPVEAAAPVAASAAGAADVEPGHRARIRATASSGTETAATAAATETGSRFSTMRFPGAERAPAVAQLDLSLSGSVIDEIMNRPAPEIPTPTGELVANKDGTSTKYDSVYTATIREDGTVSFEDKPNLHVNLLLPTPKGIRKRMKEWTKDPFGTSSGTMKRMPEDSVEDDDHDGKMDEGGIIPIIGGGFDVTDAIMRAIGDDPYSAKKAQFLERTFDERAEIGRKYNVEQLDKSEAYILDHATKLWAREDLTPADKRELLFELWDECAETGDAKQVKAADRARAALLRFIDVKLPSGSDDAYSSSEIRTLNKHRSSKQKFAPY